MSEQGQTWYDDVFAQILRLGHRYVVEAFVVIIGALLLASIVHIAYSTLADRQKRFSVPVAAKHVNRTLAPIIQTADHSDCSNVAASGDVNLECTPARTKSAKKKTP